MLAKIFAKPKDLFLLALLFMYVMYPLKKMFDGSNKERYSKMWGFLMFIPVLNLIMLYYFLYCGTPGGDASDGN
ncbi:MAG: hypothetical protein JXA18_16605 [Chitinispirillaceae bacterium]|nr:hypothetical protein [Chitinispirillaceae bacterium]